MALLSASPFYGLNLFDFHRLAGSCGTHRSLSCAHATLMPDAGTTATGQLRPLSPLNCEKRVLTSLHAIDTSSAVHLRSSSHDAPDRFITAFSIIVHHHGSLPQQHVAV
jgi:hypothetical protein